MQKITVICSLRDPIIFPDFATIIFFLDISMTFPDNTNSLTFSSYSVTAETLTTNNNVRHHTKLSYIPKLGKMFTSAS